MNIIIGIADSEMIKRLCLAGYSRQLSVMFNILLEGAYNEYEKTVKGGELS